MIQELVNFTASLDENFKYLGSLPKEGLHIRLHTVTDGSGTTRINLTDIEYEQYSKKQKEEISDFLNECKLLHQNAWCIDTNKCFDLPTKAIHSCSPFVVAFKREHLIGGKKYKENIGKKKQLDERFETYFIKAFDLFEKPEDKEKYIIYKHFFTHKLYESILNSIELDFSRQRILLTQELSIQNERLKEVVEKSEKNVIKENIENLKQKLLKVKELEDSDYILFYLNVPIEEYINAHKKYLDDKLFNTANYNTQPDEKGVMYGTSNFMNGFNSSMPFLMHQTASFDITGRISNLDAQLLNELKNIFSNKTLPNPLPIFIYKDELQEKVISIFRDSRFRFGYKEILQKLVEENNKDITNYYLLFWQNTKDGIVFKDFDYVTRFEYYLPEPIAVFNLFETKEDKKDKYYPTIRNIFDLEQQVLKSFIQNKYLRVDYFGDLDKELYSPNDLTFISYCKYRKAVYDYVFKSQRSALNGAVFDEIAFNSIKDDIKNSKSYAVKEKLNIWYSLYKYFNINKKIDMVNKLKEYQEFVAKLIGDENVVSVTDEEFAFAAGQVIGYVLSKSKSDDTSYNLLEPYLQQSKCSGLQQAIANDFGRYKHENFSRNFEKVAAFVLSYETAANMKHLFPQVLSGVFAKNQLFSNNTLNK